MLRRWSSITHSRHRCFKVNAHNLYDTSQPPNCTVQTNGCISLCSSGMSESTGENMGTQMSTEGGTRTTMEIDPSLLGAICGIIVIGVTAICVVLLLVVVVVILRKKSSRSDKGISGIQGTKSRVTCVYASTISLLTQLQICSVSTITGVIKPTRTRTKFVLQKYIHSSWQDQCVASSLRTKVSYKYCHGNPQITSCSFKKA